MKLVSVQFCPLPNYVHMYSMSHTHTKKTKKISQIFSDQYHTWGIKKENRAVILYNLEQNE